MSNIEARRSYNTLKDSGDLFELFRDEKGDCLMTGLWEEDKDLFISNYNDTQFLLGEF